jgi:hypothetical protein
MRSGTIGYKVVEGVQLSVFTYHWTLDAEARGATGSPTAAEAFPNIVVAWTDPSDAPGPKEPAVHADSCGQVVEVELDISKYAPLARTLPQTKSLPIVASTNVHKRIEPRQVGFDWNDHECKVTI